MDRQGVWLWAALLGVSVTSSGARADALTDMRATLQGLSGDAPIKAVLDARLEHLDQEENDDRVPPGHIRLDIDADGGLGIRLEPDQLQLIDQEQQAHAADPNRATPNVDLLRNTGPTQIERFVSAAPDLLHWLEGATAPELKPGQLDGVSLRQLSVQVPLLANRKYSAYAYGYHGELLLWLDPQGVPLAYQRDFHAKFCKFFLCITVDERHTVRLRVVDGRLVAVSAVDEITQSGLGQGAHTRASYGLQLERPPAP
jgi:hypothetical protein